MHWLGFIIKGDNYRINLLIKVIKVENAKWPWIGYWGVAILQAIIEISNSVVGEDWGEASWDKEIQIAFIREVGFLKE